MEVHVRRRENFLLSSVGEKTSYFPLGLRMIVSVLEVRCRPSEVAGEGEAATTMALIANADAPAGAAQPKTRVCGPVLPHTHA